MKTKNPFFVMLTLIGLMCLLSPTPPSRLEPAGSALLDRLSLRQKVELRLQNGLRNARLEMDVEDRERVLNETLEDIRSLRRVSPRQNVKLEKLLNQLERDLRETMKAERITAL